jgi:cytochrome P450
MTTSDIHGDAAEDPDDGASLRALLEGPAAQSDPHSLLRGLTAAASAHRCEPTGAPPQWLITDYQAAREVLADRRVSKRSERAGLEPGWLMSGLRDEVGVDYMLTLDPPEHTRLRQAVARAFTPRRVGELRPRTEAIARGLADEVLSQERPDLIDGYAAALPIAVICALLANSA